MNNKKCAQYYTVCIQVCIKKPPYKIIANLATVLLECIYECSQWSSDIQLFVCLFRGDGES